MGILKTLSWRKGQAVSAVVLLALAFLSAPELTWENLLPLVAVAYWLGYYVHYAVRRYWYRRVISFDLGGVLFTGDTLTQQLKEAPGMRQLVLRLREKYVVVVLSNNNELIRAGMDRRFSYDRLFDDVIYSSQTGARKPDERIYHYLLGRMGISGSRVVHVDDDPSNIAGARKAGLQAIQFDCNKQGVQELVKALRAAGIGA